MANTVFDNVVIGNKITDILTTKLDVNGYMTLDNTLAENAGMKKSVHVYKAEGNVEDLAMGVGNTGDISVSFEENEYEAKTTQGRFQYYDEEAMKDPMVVEVGLEGLAKTMINDWTKKAIAEYEKATLTQTGPVSFESVVDAIAQLKTEDEQGLFLLVPVADKAAIRKALKDDLKYSEDYVRTGYIGSIAGVPVIATNAIETGKAYLATKDAVTAFIKKDTEVEQERDANKRNNIVYVRKVAIIALTDKTKVVKFTAASEAV